MNTQPLAKGSPTVPAMALFFASLMVLASASVQAQSTGATGQTSMPMSDMHKDGPGAHDMKQAMMMGMEEMQKMPMSGDTDKDFARMMKIHHQQALNMAEMQLKTGKSAEMKTMARQIIAAQKKEITQFDQWLAKQK